MAAGETVLGMDFRPANFELYALGSTGALYRLDVTTGKATFVNSLAADPTDATAPYTALVGTSFGADFNPIPDRLRVVSDGDQNVRVNPNSGAVTTDAPIAYGGSDTNSGENPQLVASAYTNSVAGATATTLYGIDPNLDILVTQIPPNNGTLNTVGSLGINVSGPAGFDIEFRAGTNIGFAALSTDGTSSSLYTGVKTKGEASHCPPNAVSEATSFFDLKAKSTFRRGEISVARGYRAGQQARREAEAIDREFQPFLQSLRK